MKIGKKLKKNNVAVDVVNFGAAEVNGERLEAFIEAVNSGDNSHLVSVPTGTILSDTLFGSPIYQQVRHTGIIDGRQNDVVHSVTYCSASLTHLTYSAAD